MGMWDDFCDGVLYPVGELIVDGVESTGRGIDTVVTAGIEVVGGGVGHVMDTIKENPGTSTLLFGAAMIASSKSLGESILDNTLRGKATPVAGSILYCDLALYVEHSGIYLGKGEIAHQDGTGAIEIVSPKAFLGRLGGWNNAYSIYVSCSGEEAVGTASIASRARVMVGRSRKYNLILDNCHQFVSGCITGNFENSDRFLWMLKRRVEQQLGATTWRVWGKMLNDSIAG